MEETRLSVKDFIFPLFLLEGENRQVAVESMPGIYRYSTDVMMKEIEACMRSAKSTMFCLRVQHRKAESSLNLCLVIY